jgi:hypothetical protein
MINLADSSKFVENFPRLLEQVSKKAYDQKRNSIKLFILLQLR